MSALRKIPGFTFNHAVADTATPTTALFNELLANSRQGGDPMWQAVPIACLKQLIAARAWTDAALALLALHQPDWRLRRLDFDDGEWHCALSRQPAMPQWLDDTVEAHHSNMALAIVSALLAVAAEPAPQPSCAAAYPGDIRFEPMLCENFA